jgi:hypothetical protein
MVQGIVVPLMKEREKLNKERNNIGGRGQNVIISNGSNAALSTPVSSPPEFTINA